MRLPRLPGRPCSYHQSLLQTRAFRQDAGQPRTAGRPGRQQQQQQQERRSGRQGLHRKQQPWQQASPAPELQQEPQQQRRPASGWAPRPWSERRQQQQWSEHRAAPYRQPRQGLGTSEQAPGRWPAARQQPQSESMPHTQPWQGWDADAPTSPGVQLQGEALYGVSAIAAALGAGRRTLHTLYVQEGGALSCRLSASCIWS